MSKPLIVLAGATGNLGGHIAAALLDHGASVRALVVIAMTKRLAPGTDELHPPWQGMQYLRDMLGGRAKLESLDNDIYPDIGWTSVREFLAALVASRQRDR